MAISQVQQQQVPQPGSAQAGLLQTQDEAGTQRPAPRQIEPLPGDRLLKMYSAWEEAKNLEIRHQHDYRRYYHGKQWTDAELSELKKRGQPATVSNRIKRKVDFLVGIEQRLRRDPMAHPRGPGDEEGAEVATAGLRFVADNTKWPARASEAAHNGLVSGIGCIHSSVKEVIRRRRRVMELVKTPVPADRFFYDPRSERDDFSDARFLGTFQWLDIDQIDEILPIASVKARELIELARSGGADGLGATPQEFDKQKNWVDPDTNRVRVVEIHYKHEKHWLFAFIVGPVKLHEGVDPYLDEDGNTVHPYLPWSPYVDERGDRYGVVKDMMSPQDGINKRKSKLMHLLTVRQTIGEQGAVKDVAAMKREMARPDGHIERMPGKEFEVISQNDQIAGQFQLLEEDRGEIENLGPNPGLIGRGVEKQSGKAILAQQDSGMTELSPVFERLREWKLRCYIRDWLLIKQFWTDERHIRVAEEDAIEFITINQQQINPETGQIGIGNAIGEMDMDIILDEGPDTITLNEQVFDQLVEMAQSGIQIPPDFLIEMSSLRNKKRLLKRIQEANQPDPQLVQMQQQMATLEAEKLQVENQLKAVEIELKGADIELKSAQIHKLFSEKELNEMRQVKTIQEAEHIQEDRLRPHPEGHTGRPG